MSWKCLTWWKCCKSSNCCRCCECCKCQQKTYEEELVWKKEYRDRSNKKVLPFQSKQRKENEAKYTQLEKNCPEDEIKITEDDTNSQDTEKNYRDEITNPMHADKTHKGKTTNSLVQDKNNKDPKGTKRPIDDDGAEETGGVTKTVGSIATTTGAVAGAAGAIAGATTAIVGAVTAVGVGGAAGSTAAAGAAATGCVSGALAGAVAGTVAAFAGARKNGSAERARSKGKTTDAGEAGRSGGAKDAVGPEGTEEDGSTEEPADTGWPGTTNPLVQNKNTKDENSGAKESVDENAAEETGGVAKTVGSIAEDGSTGKARITGGAGRSEGTTDVVEHEGSGEDGRTGEATDTGGPGGPAGELAGEPVTGTGGAAFEHIAEGSIKGDSITDKNIKDKNIDDEEESLKDKTTNSLGQDKNTKDANSGDKEPMDERKILEDKITNPSVQDKNNKDQKNNKGAKGPIDEDGAAEETGGVAKTVGSIATTTGAIAGAAGAIAGATTAIAGAVTAVGAGGAAGSAAAAGAAATGCVSGAIAGAVAGTVAAFAGARKNGSAERARSKGETTDAGEAGRSGVAKDAVGPEGTEGDGSTEEPADTGWPVTTNPLVQNKNTKDENSGAAGAGAGAGAAGAGVAGKGVAGVAGKGAGAAGARAAGARGIDVVGESADTGGPAGDGGVSAEQAYEGPKKGDSTTVSSNYPNNSNINRMPDAKLEVETTTITNSFDQVKTVKASEDPKDKILKGKDGAKDTKGDINEMRDDAKGPRDEVTLPEDFHKSGKDATAIKAFATLGTLQLRMELNPGYASLHATPAHIGALPAIRPLGHAIDHLEPQASFFIAESGASVERGHDRVLASANLGRIGTAIHVANERVASVSLGPSAKAEFGASGASVGASLGEASIGPVTARAGLQLGVTKKKKDLEIDVGPFSFRL